MANLPILANWVGALSGTTSTSVVPYSQLQSFFSFQGSTDPITTTAPPANVGSTDGIFYFNTVNNTLWYLKSITGTTTLSYNWIDISNSSSSTVFIISTTDPTTTTVGELGQGLYNTTTNSIWVCTAVSATNPIVYTWQQPSNAGSGVSGGTTVLFDVDPGTSVTAKGSPYLVAGSNDTVAIPIPLGASTNQFSTYSGNGNIGTVPYIQSSATSTITGNSIIFPTSLVANKYNVYLTLKNIETVVRITTTATTANNVPTADWTTEFSISPKSVITNSGSPINNANVWSPFISPVGNENDSILITAPAITVSSVPESPNQFDIRIEGGEWYMAALSATNGYIGSATTEYLAFFVIKQIGANITAVTVPTTFDNFISGNVIIGIDLIGIGGGSGITYIPNSPRGTIAISGAENENLDIAQQGATNGQVLSWNGSKFSPSSLLQSDYGVTDSSNISFIKNKPIWASGTASPTTATDGNIYIKYNKDSNNIPIDITFYVNTNGVWSAFQSMTDLIEALSYNEIKNISFVSMQGVSVNSNLDVDNTLGLNTAANTSNVVLNINKGLITINLTGITTVQNIYFNSRYFPNSTIQYTATVGTWLINILSYSRFADESGQIIAVLPVNTGLYNQAITTLLAAGGIITNSTITFTGSTVINNLFGTSADWNSSVLNSYIKFDNTGNITSTKFPISSTYVGTDASGNIVTAQTPVPYIPVSPNGTIAISGNGGTNLDIAQQGATNGQVLSWDGSKFSPITIQSGTQVKQSADIATTTNITLSGLQTIQGVTLNTTSRVVVVGQTDATTNGIYNPASGAWTRASDANTIALLVGASIYINNGDNEGDTFFCNISSSAILGTSNITFIISADFNAFSVVNSVVTAGTGISKTKNNNKVIISANTQLTDATQVIGLDASGAFIKSTLPSNSYLIGTDANSNIVAQTLAIGAQIVGTDANGQIIKTVLPTLAQLVGTNGVGNIIKTVLTPNVKVFGTNATGDLTPVNPPVSAYLLGTDSDGDFTTTALTASAQIIGTNASGQIIKTTFSPSIYLLGTDANSNIVAQTLATGAQVIGTNAGGQIIKSQLPTGSAYIGTDANGNIVSAQIPVTGALIKEVADVATLNSLTSLSGLDPIQGVTITTTSRIVVAGQGDQRQNGIYNPASGAWTRTPDANTSALLVNALVYVKSGDNAGDSFYCNSPTTTVIGNDNITFIVSADFNSFNAVNGALVAGNGLGKTSINNQVVLSIRPPALGSIQSIGFDAAGDFVKSTFPASSYLIGTNSNNEIISTLLATSAQIIGTDSNGQIIKTILTNNAVILGTDSTGNVIAKNPPVSAYLLGTDTSGSIVTKSFTVSSQIVGTDGNGQIIKAPLPASAYLVGTDANSNIINKSFIGSTQIVGTDSNGQIIKSILPVSSYLIGTDSNSNIITQILATSAQIIGTDSNGQIIKTILTNNAVILGTDSTGNIVSKNPPVSAYLLGTDTSGSIVTKSFTASLQIVGTDGNGQIIKAPLPSNSAYIGTDANGNIVSAPLPVSGTLIKEVADIGTTTNITLSGLQTIQGITLTTTSRVVVAGQTDATTNGIYNPASGAWTRASDANTIALLVGALVYVKSGDNIGDSFYCNISSSAVLGTSNITFIVSADFNSLNAVNGALVAGNGLTKTIVNNQVQLSVLPPTLATAIQSIGFDASGNFVKSTFPASAQVVGTDANNNIITTILGNNIQVLGTDSNGQLQRTALTANANFLGTDANGNIVSRVLPTSSYLIGTDSSGSIITRSLPANARFLATDSNGQIEATALPMATRTLLGAVYINDTNLLIGSDGGLSLNTNNIELNTLTVDTLLAIGNNLRLDSVALSNVKVLATSVAGNIIANNPPATSGFIGTDGNRNWVARNEFLANYSTTTTLPYTSSVDVKLTGMSAGGTGLFSLGTAPITYNSSTGVFTYSGTSTIRVLVEVVASVAAVPSAQFPTLFIVYGSSSGSNRVAQTNLNYNSSAQGATIALSASLVLGSSGTNNTFTVYYWNSIVSTDLTPNNAFPFAYKVTISGIS